MTPGPRAPSPGGGERGAVFVLTVFAMVFIAVLAAIAIDLSSVRNDRADNQVAADNAAAAGVMAYNEDGGQLACQQALIYLQTNLGYAMTGADCSGFPVRCDALTPSATTAGASGDISITITHPVDDADPLMQPGAIGAANVAVGSADGDRCARVGVSITEVHRNYFGGMVGITTLTSTVHAVALDGTDRTDNGFANLVLLERHECDALSASNGAGIGGILVRQVVKPNGDILPGRVAVDSDGTVSCSSKGTVAVNGTNALIQADGPPGCATEVLVGTGQGCGVLETFALGPPGCVMPACSNTGSIHPPPTRMSNRVTRAPVDHRWNCKSSYPASYQISGCYLAGHGGPPPYIDQLIADIGTSNLPVGYRSYRGEGYDCNVSSSTSVVVPAGNWIVDCPNKLQIAGSVVFTAGNVVFDSDVTVNGTLSINGANTTVLYSPWSPGDPVDHELSSATAAYLFIRDGTFSKGGNGQVWLHSTFVYIAPGSNVDLTGNSGILSWIAPTEGPFESLAMWSDSDQTNSFSGQATLTMQGIFFSPLATLSYSGNGTQLQVAAQYVVEKLHVSGQGRLEILPNYADGVIFPREWPTVLIR